jgi:hypothetical protein
MTSDQKWRRPNSIPFIVLALGVLGFMLAFFDRWDMDPWRFSLLITSAGLGMLVSELLALHFLETRELSVDARARWFLHYGLASIVGSITLVAVLGIVGLAQDRAPFVLGIVIVVQVLNIYVLAFTIDEITTYRIEAQRIRTDLGPALQSVRISNALLTEIEAVETSQEINTITKRVQLPLDRITARVSAMNNESAARALEEFVDETLRPLSHRMHPTSVATGITAAAGALGIHLVLDNSAKALDATNNLLDAAVLLEFHRWLTNTADTNANSSEDLVVHARVDMRSLRIDLKVGTPAPVDARHAVAGIRAVGASSIELPLSGQFVDPVSTSFGSDTGLNGNRDYPVFRERSPRLWTGEQNPSPYLVAALALVAVPSITFIGNAQVTSAILLAATIATLLPVTLAIALTRIRVSGSGWWPPAWIVVSWLGVGLVSGLGAAATLDAFSSGISTGQWFTETLRAVLRISLLGIAISFFGEFAAQARNLAERVRRQTLDALDARTEILDREHDRSRLVAEVLHRQVQSRLAAIVVLFRFDRRTEAVAELGHVTGTLIPDLVREMSRAVPASPPLTAPPARPFGFTVSQVDSPELELILTNRGDAARTIIDECATNALKHGSATRMVVSAEIQGQELVVHCVDDGVGLPGGPQHHGLGSRMFDEEIGIDAWSLTRDGDRTIAEFRFPWQHGDVTLTPGTDSADGILPR